MATFLSESEVAAVEQLGGQQLFEAHPDRAIQFRQELVTDTTVEIKNLLKQFELLSNKKQSIFGFENAISALRKTRLPLITLHFSANRFAGKLYTTAQDDCLHVVAGVIVDMSNRPTKVQKPADWDGSSDAT
ncbi:MAG TPA: hypothetical protein VFV57_01220 [Limnobacter sp.]|nr:hypothetical protein [Limnobacter sp.]